MTLVSSSSREPPRTVKLLDIHDHYVNTVYCGGRRSKRSRGGGGVLMVGEIITERRRGHVQKKKKKHCTEFTNPVVSGENGRKSRQRRQRSEFQHLLVQNLIQKKPNHPFTKVLPPTLSPPPSSSGDTELTHGTVCHKNVLF